MSLKKNILANYASQIYVTLIGMIMVPMYIKYMGAEAYGLVGFFTMLQVWFNMLDLGLTPTMARETARFHGGATDALNYRRLVRALEGIFFSVALVGGAAMFALSGYIAKDWLQASLLPLAEVQTAVQLMAIIIAMRWMCGLYRGAISGSERLVWLSGFNSIIATLRFIVVIPLLIFIGVTPTIFFIFQFCVAIIELVVLLYYAYQLLPTISNGQRLNWEWSPVIPVLKFSLSVAFTSSLWVLVTQTDKLILSKLLPLQDFAFFTLGVLVASSVGFISGPISSALLPRMTKLNAEGDEVGVIRVYQNTTQLLCVMVIPATLVLAFFSQQILWVWTGNADIAREIAPVLKFYVLGNGILAISSLAYCLQYAKGDLRLHLMETPLFLAIFLPGLLWSVAKYGMSGAGYAWLGTMIVFFVFWLPLIHRRFIKGLHVSWLIHDVGYVLVISFVVVALGYTAMGSQIGLTEKRLPLGIMISLLGLTAFTLSALGSKLVRETILRQLQIYFKI
jgi:O-antigen/teichoic acid export membrane protein